MENNGGGTRIKVLLVVLILAAVGLAAEFFYVKPGVEGFMPRKWRTPTPSPTLTRKASPTPSTSPKSSPSPNVSPATTYFSDSFAATLSKWDIVYTGYGQVLIENGLLSMAPLVSKASTETHAALVAPTAASWNSTWKDYDFSVRTNTIQQLRVGSTPNPWEVGWVLFRYVDAQHFYYFIPKTNGIELGKFTNGSQKFLATADLPKLSLNAWSTYKVSVKGNVIKVYINGTQVVNFTDSNSPYLSGKIGLYTEDAHVHYDDVSVISN